MSGHSYLKEAKINYHKTPENPIEDARTAALIAIAEQAARLADAAERIAAALEQEAITAGWCVLGPSTALNFASEMQAIETMKALKQKYPDHHYFVEPFGPTIY